MNMSDYRCYAFRNYEISKEVYNYLLPIYGRCAFENGFKRDCGSPFIIERDEMYFFCGTTQDYKEMQERCKYI
jgi:hypothetical protein